MTGWNLPPGCTDADTDGPSGPFCSVCGDQINEDRDSYILVKGKFLHVSCATVSHIILAEHPSREDLAEMAEERERDLLTSARIHAENKIMMNLMKGKIQ